MTGDYIIAHIYPINKPLLFLIGVTYYSECVWLYDSESGCMNLNVAV